MSWGEWWGLHGARTQIQATPLHTDVHSHQQVCTHVHTHTHTRTGPHLRAHTHSQPSPNAKCSYGRVAFQILSRSLLLSQ